MKKLVVLFITCLMLFTASNAVVADTIVEPSPNTDATIIDLRFDGKVVSYNLLHNFIVENMTEEQIIKLYYKVYLNREADEWDVDFWSKRITPTDTTLLTYGVINSDTFKAKCEQYGFKADEYFIEEGVFTEGISSEGEECGLTPNGDYVFYATFGDSTYYHVVYGADAVNNR